MSPMACLILRTTSEIGIFQLGRFISTHPHNHPYVRVYRTALEVEGIVRAQNVVPATIGILDGKVHVGKLYEHSMELEIHTYTHAHTLQYTLEIQ